jgi:hypothetical protein
VDDAPRPSRHEPRSSDPACDRDVDVLAVRVIPRARRDEVGGERAGRLLVRTTAAPVDDAANEAVRRLVAAHRGVAAPPRRDRRRPPLPDKTLRVRRERPADGRRP